MSTRLSPQQRIAWDLGPDARQRAWVRIPATVAPERLEAALARVCARHDILRTHFRKDARLKYPQQHVDGPGDLSMKLERDEKGLIAELSLPSLCADAATMRLLVAAWDAELDGAATVADDEPITYQQFSEWQNDLTPEPRASLVDAPELPYEGAAGGPAERSHCEHALGPSIATALQTLARGCEVSVAAVCQAVFAALLARLTGRDEVPFAFECAGRDFEDVRMLLGPVARWQPVATNASGPLDRTAIRRAEEAIRAANEDDAPLADPGALPRALGFAFRSFVTAGTLRITRAEIDQRGPRHVLAVHETANGLTLALSYDRARLAEQSARTLLAQVAYGLDELIGTRLPQRLAFERRLPTHFRRTACTPLHEAFAHHAANHPDRLALVCGDEQLRYGELDRRASQLAHRLGAIPPGAPIGLWAERKASTIVGMLAILKAGGAYVPLDPEAPTERLRQQLHGLHTLVARSHQDVPNDHPIAVISEDSGPGDDLPKEVSTRRPHLDELASMIFTSGSTGTPKAVAITHRGIASYTQSILALLGLEGPAHFATVSTLSADLGNTSLFGALASGGVLHVIDYATATDGARFAAYCARWPLDVLKIVPSHLAALLDAGAEILPRAALLTGGEALTPALRARVSALVPALPLFNHYGPTETTVGALALPTRELDDERGCTSIPIGRPLGNAEAYVLDEHGELTATGVTGELYLGGDGLARGYDARPDLTAERFVPHPFADGARLYRTGDFARYRPDGTIEFLGRRDHQLKIRGFRVEIGEIEARLAELPGCTGAAVLARPSASGGHTLIGFVVPASGALDEQEARRFLAARLPDYMIPGELVQLPSLPRTRNGKVDRAELARRSDERARCAYVAPRDETERALCSLWSELLHVPQVGVDDDFFALGGHSLLAIPLVHRIRETLGGALSLQAIFESPTVAGIARALASGRTWTALREQGTERPLFCFDPTGRHADAYRPIAASITDRPVYVLSHDAIDGEELARQVRARQPDGPYHLLGWSLGGVLALATAQALEKEGQPVAFLGILDTDPRIDLYAQGEPDPVVELAAYLTVAEGETLRAAPASAHDALREALENQTEAARSAAAVKWAKSMKLIDHEEPAELFHARYTLLRAASLYVLRMQQRGLAAPIAVWWSADTRARRGAHLPAWQRHTRGTVSEQVVAGDHVAVLTDERVLSTVATMLSGAR